ncbi:helix-turn-helix domain-containing protein [Elizabethkingia sp. M8]|uniref:helix-turn-helix domain-containing protein n=1 Tax=Elizabethkingia sp. M8 TaxID=2796140 RepID=UPI001904D826|nr:helix-turn-helix domain-containing protein [Elizabethkingia sp. M8]QQM25858.1 helix-turn-helix domain-containing protein [Elizabethkingia sp. M8]
MMKYIFPIIIFLFSNLVSSQKNKIDSLYEFNYPQLKNQFYDYNDHNKVPEAKQIAKYYLQKAKKEKNTFEIAEGYNLTHFNEDFPTALKYIDSLAVITKKINGNLYPARTYLIKGNLYYKHDNLKAALDNYILGMKYAKEQNDERQTAYANMNIAYINSYIGKNEEAAKIFRYYLHNRNNITDDYQHNQMRIALISCYLEINKLDSANILIREGQASASTNKNNYDLSLYSFLSGVHDLKLKKYNTAITKLSKVYDDLIKINENNANLALYSLGKAYDGLKDNEKVVETYIKLDSKIQKTDITFPELREVYTYLIDYYKEKNDKEKQLYYIDRFFKIDKKLDEQFRYLSTELPKKYDTPTLLQEKENIINELKRKKILFYITIGIMALLLLTLLFLYYKSRRAEIIHRKIAQDLINSIEERHKTDPETEVVNEEPVQQEQKVVKNIPEEVVQAIFKELQDFEKNEHFLKKGITLSSLAQSINTNTAYLSEVINTHKEKNFTAYLNDLRIDYALERLIEDKRFRSCKLAVIADELGYNNTQAFTAAFKKKTKTTFSTYIKEIEKQRVFK